MASEPGTGIVPIRFGDYGLNYSRNPSRIPSQALFEALGVLFTDDTVRKEPGASLLGTNSTSVPAKIRAIYDWHPVEGTQRVVHLAGDGKIYQTTDAAPTDVDAASSAIVAVGGDHPLFVQAGEEEAANNRKLFLFSGKHAVVYLDGDTTTATTVANPPADWSGTNQPVFGVMHGGRLWAGGNLSDPHRVYASSPNNHGYFINQATLTGNPALTFDDNGATADTITRAAGDWTSDGFAAGQEIAITGTSDNDGIYTIDSVTSTVITLEADEDLTDEASVSDVNITTLGSTGNSLDFGVGVGVGERLWVGRSFKGMLFFWKYPRGIYWLDDTDINTAGWRIRQLTDSIGCAPTPHSVLQLEDSFLFMAPDGTFYVLKVTTQGGMTLAPISEQMQIDYYMEKEVNKGALENVLSVWYPRRRMAMFVVPKKGEVEPTLRLMFDFRRMNETGVPRFSVSDRDEAWSITTRRDPDTNVETPMFGDSTGKIYLMEQDERNKNGVAYTGRWRTPNDDFSAFEGDLANINKVYRWVQIEYIPTVSGTLTLDVFVDGTIKQTISVTLQAAGDEIGTFTIGTSALASSDNLVTIQKTLNVGEGRRISVRGTNSTLDEDFNITNLYIGYSRGSARLSAG